MSTVYGKMRIGYSNVSAYLIAKLLVKRFLFCPKASNVFAVFQIPGVS